MIRLLLLVYVLILDKKYLWKISAEDDIEKINYIGRHSAARLGRGFQTRPYPVFSHTLPEVIGSLKFFPPERHYLFTG